MPNATTFEREHPVLFFALLCVLPVHVVLWGAIALGASPESLQPLKLLFALLPSAAAFFLSWRIGGESAVVDLARRTFVRGAPLWTYGVALGGFAVLGVAALLARMAWDGHTPTAAQWAPWSRVLLVSPFLFAVPAIAEEYGWRGFMQTRLQGGTSVLTASLLVGLTWGTWHTMDFLMGNWTAGPGLVATFYGYIVGSSVLIGALYARSGGSIVIAMLAHFGVNATSEFLPLWTDDAGLGTPLLFIALMWLTGLALAGRFPLVSPPGDRG